ncbi:MAG TPA: peptidase [Gammaproteobacteria bacterium]|nr:peptidase [Gammaproteobacteria bacterium]
MKLNTLTCAVAAVAIGATGFFVGRDASTLLPSLSLQLYQWDSEASDTWPSPFVRVEISRADKTTQPAYYLSAPQGDPKPLVVSLHTWSGDYTQHDPLAPLIQQAGWNYIHPNAQGPNNTPNACLSDRVIHDIDDAIQFALDQGHVDAKNIFVVGASGGGYTALGAYLRSRHTVRAYLAWVPISNLLAWFHQAPYHNEQYANDILACTDSRNGTLNEDEAKRRSPLYWPLPDKLPQRIELYAGIDDGHTGAVPISHTINFYNRIAGALGHDQNRVTEAAATQLLTRAIDRTLTVGVLGDRGVFYQQDTGPVSLSIFDGGHELLPAYSVARMRGMVGE